MNDIKQNEEMLIDILEKKNFLRHKINQGAQIQSLKNNINLKDISLFHIEELTFEEDSPRREAFENVISTIRIDGIIFVYLLIGDKNGVSFYFGISKDLSYENELELDVDDIGKILKSSIEGNFRGSKVVEVKKEKKEILNKLDSMQRFAKVEGVPSINKDTEGFQGVDRLVDVMMGDEFILLVLADPLTYKEVENIESSLYNIYNKLSPLAKFSLQESNGETNTKGGGNTKNYSKTDGASDSIAMGTTKGTSTGTSESKSSNGSSSSSSSSSNSGGSESSSNTKTKGTSISETMGTSDTTNDSKAINTGISKSREFSNKVANEWLSYIDEILLKRIDYGRSKGIFNSSIYLMTSEKGISTKLGNTIKSLFSGSEDNKAPLHLEYIENKNEIKFIKNFQIPLSKISLDKNHHQARMLLSKNSTKEASWLSTSELSVIATLPQKEVVGLALKEEIEFGLNVKKELVSDSDENIFLGNLVQSGKILDIKINLKKDNLDKHIFIAGVTGSGKTTTCQRILESANMPFMVIEPAKTEYRVMLNKRDDLLIFTLGDDRVAPFRLNPFEFFPHESISSRVDMIKANIEAAFDMEAAIPQIIEAALYSSYEEYGWDIATSKNLKYEDAFADGVFAFPTLSDLIKQTEIVVEKQGFDERLKKDYIGSIKARLQGLIVGSKGFMLNTHRSIDFMDLIEKNVILELDEIKNGGEKSLIMGFVLININEALKSKHEEYKKNNKKFRHITLIEEAHRLLSKYSPGDSPNKKLGVETFADMLAEVRKYGESLIIVDQIPNKLTPEVLKNTNTKIVHKIFAQDDKEAIGNTMALNDDQKRFLSNLEMGRVIIFNQDFAKPIQVQIKQLESVSTTTSEDISKEDIRKIVLSYYQKHYKRGMILGIESHDKIPTLEQVEEALSFKINGVANHWFKIFENLKVNIDCDNIKNHLLENKLSDKVDFISKYITQKFYKDEEGVSISEKSIYVRGFLDKVLIENKIELSRDEQRILKIR